MRWSFDRVKFQPKRWNTFWFSVLLYVHRCTGMLQQPYSREWNEVFTELMERGELIDTGYSSCTIRIKLDGEIYKIWSTNRPYSFGHCWCDGHDKFERVRPSCKNLIRFYTRLRDETSI